MKQLKFDYLVIGSGIAGLSAAKILAKTSKVALISKQKFEEGSTHYAQGGIAVAINKTDAPALHFQDTIKAGAGLCNEAMVKILVEEGPERVQELIKLGIHFDRVNNEFDLTKEGAHSQRRILHAKDETGREIETTLLNYLKTFDSITFMEHTFVKELIVQDNVCLGCVIISKSEPQVLLAKAIIIATGGCGQIFSHTTNPPVATGDGIAMAFQKGAVLEDMEFIQFHPTTLYLGDKKPISIFLISEAVRGEGAVLRNNKGERFMLNYHPDAELAPRDIVARSIIAEIKKTKAECVFLDLTAINKDIQTRFPLIYRRCLEANIDITKDLIPVSPAAHYFMGGIKTDAFGRTNIINLYAIGEAAALAVHGANRLASNSLLDGLVFGYRASYDALEIKKELAYLPEDFLKAWLAKQVVISKEQKVESLVIKQKIRKLMWQNVGIIRNQTGLQKALDEFEKMSYILDFSTLEEEFLEVQNMLIIAKLITFFALARKESRGAHYRSDFPKIDDANWQIHQ